jgi:signal transduction histidine kinase
MLSLLPAALFVLTLLAGTRHRRHLSRGVPPIAAALLASLIPQLFAEFLVFGAASTLADANLLAAHGLKLFAALLPMGALALELGLRQRELLRASDELEQAHGCLERRNAQLGSAQTALELQQQRLDSALAAGGTGTFVWHMDVDEVVFDDHLTGTLGLSEDERRGMSRQRFVAKMPEEAQKAFGEQVKQSLMGASHVGMTFPWTRDNSTLHMRCSARLERDAEGLPLRMVGTLTDVTRQVEADEAQHAAERRVRRFLDALPLGVYVEDRLGRTYYANAEAKLLLAGTADEDEGDVTIVLRLSAASTFPPSMDTIGGGQKAKLPLLRSRAGERSVEDVELDTPAGHRVVRMWGAPIYDELGERVEFAMAVTQDVTELRQLEAERMQGQKLEAIGQLAAGIAHEINTPTQYVSDNTHFFETAFKRLEPFLDAAEAMVEAKKQDAVTDEHFTTLKKTARKAKLDFVRREVPKAIEQSLEGLDRVATIVRAMKEFSHPGGGGMCPTDLNRAVQTTVTVARNEWKYVAEVEFDLAEDLPNVPVLPDELNQVILNIVVNAAHAIAAKLGEESAEKGTIKLATRLVEDHVEIVISDDGTGVPAAIQERVFDPFFTTKPVGKGTGQGLAIARKVMLDGHHGDLKLDSVEGEGATFTLVLPLEQPDTAEGTVEAAE